MPLPILHTTTQVTPETLVRLFHKTEYRWTEHVAEPMQLSIGSAFTNPELPRVHEANRIVDVALPADLSVSDAMKEVEAHYATKGVNCFTWTMNPSATHEQTAPVIEHLLASGFRREASPILYLDHMPKTPIAQAAGLKIIPARASFRHARELSAQAVARWNEPQLTDAAMLHLDDPHWDALIALQDGQAVGEVGVLAVGEVGRIDHVFVSPDFRRKGIGRTLVSRALEICARSLFKHVFLSCLADNQPALALYAQFGFRQIGEIVSYFDSRLCAPMES